MNAQRGSAVIAIGVLALLVCAPVPARAAEASPKPRIAIDDVAGGRVDATLGAAGALPFPVAVRVTAASPGLDAALDLRLADLSKRGIPIWLSMPAPETPEAIEQWRVSLRTLVSRYAEALTIFEVAIDRQPERVAAFAVQTASTEIGEDRVTVRIALGGPALADAVRRTALFNAELAPYVDMLAIPAGEEDAVRRWLDGLRIAVSLAITPLPGSDARVMDAVLQDLGTSVAIRSMRATEVSPASLRALVPLTALLTHEVTPLDDEGVELGLTVSGQDVVTNTRKRLLFDTDTFSTFLVYWRDVAAEPMGVTLISPMEGTPALMNLETGARAAPTGYSRDSATGRVALRVPQTGHAMLVDFNEGAVAIAERSGVTAVRALSVIEIIARHQQQQRAQDALIQDYMAKVRMEQHFRPTVADPGYDVVTENRYFSATDGIEWQELSFAVNNSKWGADRPPFPLLQPEKVLALPLQLRFDEGYRYRLAGTERVDDFDCYVVRFDPVREDSALYRGTVWIDQRTFARVRVKAVQGGLAAPVVSNEEDQRFTVVTTIGNRPIFLFNRLIAKQILLVAGRNLLVEKIVNFSDFRVNSSEFEQERASARESRSVMLRETPNGLRYYVLENGRRVVSEHPSLGVRAMAMGVTLDPSYTFPLPIFGINVLDFEFGNKDTQLALLFAGVLVAGNVQRSNFGVKKLDASVDFFAIAAPSTDRMFSGGVEESESRLLTWPMSTGLNLGWQATPFMKAMLQYQFRFDAFVPDRTTDPDYIVPVSTATNGIGGTWEYRRGGYSGVMNGSWFKRANWEPWGTGESTPSTFLKYSVGLTRDFFIGAFQKVHLNGQWYSGRDLDRFNKYQFGLFDDTRIHGVPASGVRFAELAMARGTYSFNIFDQYRFDVFIEHAWGRDEPRQGDWSRIPGLGAAFNVRAPWNTILRADFGKSMLPARYGNLGSTTLQIMLLKPLR